MKTEIKKWYMENYASDDLGENIKDGITFNDVFETLSNYENVYDTLGVGDSIIRERVFTELARLLNKKYDYIYYLWLQKI